MFKRILVALDGSDTATKALISALQLARDGDGRVRLLHVMDEQPIAGGFDMYGGYSGDLIDAMRKNGASILNDGLAIAQSAGVEADISLYDKFGERLGDAVAEASRTWKADLIVVGTHGRRGVGRLLLGSGAEQIVRLAPVPVLVMRAADETSTTP